MDDLVVVGSLVPSLLVDQGALPEGALPHVETLDLDVGLSVALLEEGRVRTLTERLRGAGFSPGMRTRRASHPTAMEGRARRESDSRLSHRAQPARRSRERRRSNPSSLRSSLGLHLAFEDREEVTLAGETLFGEEATRRIWVAGPGAYVVLKALAFDDRGENKDAYDLFYLIRNYGTGVEDVARRLRPLLADAAAVDALAVLRRDFHAHNAVGPRRVAEFMVGQPDDAIQADTVGYLRSLLDALSRS